MRFCWFLCCLVLAGWLCPVVDGRQPNLVVFLADDAGWGDYSSHGNAMLKTPNLDRLAGSGARFENFFVCALCAPTRAEFLTGRYHSRGGVKGVSEGLERLNLDESTLAESLKRAGYRNGLFGKWHNGSQWPYHPMARGFDEFVGYTSGHWGEYFDAPLEENGRMIETRGFIVDVLVDRAISFIETNRGRPFFCYIPLTTPHSPFSVPESYWQRHAGKAISQRGPDGEAEDANLTRCVHAMMEHLDDSVARVQEAIRKSGLERDTVVVWFSDNGPNSGRWNAGLKGRKGQLDEGGVKSPLWISWPGRIAAGTVVRSLAGAIDLRPSLLGLLGVTDSPSLPLDGQDWSAALLGTSPGPINRTLFQYNSGRLSLRTDTHRLDASGELYDLRVDPRQQQAVSDSQAALRSELLERASQWHRQVWGKPYQPQPPQLAKSVKGAAKGGTRTIRQGHKPTPVHALDERPYPVGFSQFPLTMLEARDGLPVGSVLRSSSAPNCSYFVNWKDGPQDGITWDVEVHQAGRYEVVLDQACAPGNQGCTIRLEFSDQSLEARVPTAWWPPLHDQDDRVPRKGESVMRSFAPFRMGEINLPKARGLIKLTAHHLQGPEAIELRRLNLRLLP